ncbi:hypothetical protein KY360_06880 [Candidatus Woesearchaeota archaeon]|nr:hypothetical protein [Candidatus Woesearchaeota archaeon]
MTKTKSKIKRGISKSKKIAKLSKSPKVKSKKAPKLPKPSKKIPPKAKISKPEPKKEPPKPVKKDLDLLPPPPPDFYKKKEGEAKGFTPSGHELSRIIVQLRNDIDFIANNRKFLDVPDEKLVGVSTGKIIKILDRLRDENKHVNELKKIEDKINCYEALPKKGWLSAGKIKEARNYLEAFKLISEEIRPDIVKRLESIRIQREREERKFKAEEEQAKKHKIVESLEKPEIAEEKPKPKAKEMKLEKPKAEKPARKKSIFKSIKLPKFKPKEKPEPAMPEFKPSQHELRKHVFQLKTSLDHVRKSEGLFKRIDGKLHSLTHKELHSALGKLKTAKEHLGQIEDIEEHIAAKASVPQGRRANNKLGVAKKLLDAHKLDTGKTKGKINEKIKAVKKKIGVLEKEGKKKKLLEEETAKFVPKLSELKKHLRYVVANRKITQIPDDRLSSLSSSKLYEISNKLNVLKQYLNGIEDIEEHFVAESSKPGALTADKHLEDTRKLIESYKLDTGKDKTAIDGKLDLIKTLAKTAEKEKPKEGFKIPLPKFKPKPGAEKPEPEKPKEIEQPKELEVPIPKFEKPEPELAKLVSRLRKNLDYAVKNEKLLQLPDDKLKSLSSWRVRRIAKNLNSLKQNLDELEEIEEHIAAESSMPKGLTAEKLLEDATKIMDAHKIDVAKSRKIADAKLHLIQTFGKVPLKLGKPELVEQLPKKEELKIEKPEKPEEIKPAKEEKLKEEKPEAEEIPPPLKLGRPKPELAMQIYRLKKNLDYVAKTEKTLEISDEVLRSISSWRLRGITKRLNALKERLDNIEDIEEHIAAEGSVSQVPAVEKQLEKAREIMDGYNIDAAKKLKTVNARIDFIQSLKPAVIKPEIKVPELKEKPKPEIKLPELKIEKPPKVKVEKPKPEMPKIAEKPVKLPKVVPGVPVFKPSPAELYLLICRLKRDLNYVAKHERLLHVPDEKVLSLSHGKLDTLFEQLKSEETYLNDIEQIEKSLSLYEQIPKKGWLSNRRINEARRLLEAYKSTDVGITRKMLVSRLNLMKDRKLTLEDEREKKISEALAAKRAKLAGEAETLKKVEEHVEEHEKKTAEEFEADLRSTRLLKLAEEEKLKRIGAPEHKVVKIEPSKPEKPILEKESFEAHKEITEAIGAIKAAKPEIRNKIEYIMQKIDEARRALEGLDVHTAKTIYLDLHGVYMQMKPLEQYRVYEALKDLYEERKSAEDLVS